MDGNSDKAGDGDVGNLHATSTEICNCVHLLTMASEAMYPACCIQSESMLLAAARMGIEMGVEIGIRKRDYGGN